MAQTIPQSIKLADKAPLDGRYIFDTLEAATLEAYNGASFYITSLKEWYKFKLDANNVLISIADAAVNTDMFALKTDLNGLATSVLATGANDGLMSKEYYAKLRDINPAQITLVQPSTINGNIKISGAEVPVYIRPSTSTDRPVTDTEKLAWNAKAESVHVHSNYSLNTHNHNSEYSGINHEHQVWDAGLGYYREKYVLANSEGGGGDATSLSGVSLNNNATGEAGNDGIWTANKVTSVVNAKVNELATGLSWKAAVNTYNDIATTYPSPVDGWTVTTKDTDKTWRFDGASWVDISAGNIPLATQAIDGKMSATDKTKLDGIATGANNYTHPASHLASFITEETDKRFMTDTERTKLSGIATGATNTPLSASAPLALGTPAVGVSTNAARADHVHAIPDPATQSAQGLMSATDKTKLDGIATGANNYTHPASHAPSIITQDANNRFFTDTERTKLSGISTGATNTPLSSVAPSALGTAAVGVSTNAARADHVHTMPTATNIGLGNVTNESKATMFTNPVFTGSVIANKIFGYSGLEISTNDSAGLVKIKPFDGTNQGYCLEIYALASDNGVRMDFNSIPFLRTYGYTNLSRLSFGVKDAPDFINITSVGLGIGISPDAKLSIADNTSTNDILKVLNVYWNRGIKCGVNASSIPYIQSYVVTTGVGETLILNPQGGDIKAGGAMCATDFIIL